MAPTMALITREKGYTAWVDGSQAVKATVLRFSQKGQLTADPTAPGRQTSCGVFSVRCRMEPGTCGARYKLYLQWFSHLSESLDLNNTRAPVEHRTSIAWDHTGFG